MLGDDSALDDGAFAALMAPLGPFEPAPALAVATSGGADSLALALLADRWARRRGGSATAVCVDHGLRAEAAAEAAQVAAWLGARGIASHVLRWDGPKPASGIEAAARKARYALLEDWCERFSVLHLLLAHHRDDQAETVLMRLGRGSGIDGLAAMAPVTETPRVRLLRPLLTLPHRRLVATLRAAGQPWIEDPSNADPRYERVRWRRRLAGRDEAARHLAAAAAAFGGARAGLEEATALALAACVTLHPAGFVRVAGLDSLPDVVARRLLSAVCRTVGGTVYPPRSVGLERFCARIRGPSPRRSTLAGCVAAPVAGTLLVCREARNLEPSRVAPPAAWVRWDGRFALRLRDVPGRFQVGALGAMGWLTVHKDVPVVLPAPVRTSLPALFDDVGVAEVPHLGYKRDAGPSVVERIVFAPERALAPQRHCLV